MVYGAVRQGVVEGPTKVFSYGKIIMPAQGDRLGCKAIATSMLYEDDPLGERSKHVGRVKVLAEHGTDTLSLRIDEKAQTLMLLTGAAVKLGMQEPEVMTIVRADADVLVAVQVSNFDSDIYVIRLDRKTGNAVWSKTGTMLMAGLVGWSHYLECR